MLFVVIASGVFQAIIAITQNIKQGSVGLGLLGESPLVVNAPGVAVFIADGEKYLRAYGLTPHPNILAAWIFVAIFAFYFWYLISIKKTSSSLPLHSRVGVGVYTVLLWSFLLSFSRTIVGLWVLVVFVGLPLLFLKKFKSDYCLKQGVLKLFIVSVAVVAIFSFVFWAQVKSRIHISANEEAVTQRVYYNKVAGSVAASHPAFGVGIGQFVPDMMPSDIVGGFDPVSKQVKLGPISKANIVLPDEINRAGPKTQAAMLQIMGEGAISLEGIIHPLPDPFFVLATENPIEEEGTYDLPVAQLDRFLLKIWMGFLDIKGLKKLCLDSRNYYEFQKRILSEIHPVVNLRTICEIYDFAGSNVSVTEEIADYVAHLIYASRPQNFKECGISAEEFKDDVWIGLSDRVAPFTIETAKRIALLKGRDWIKPSDIKEIAHGVFDHRIVLTLKGRSKGKIRDLPREREFVNELLAKIMPQ